MVGGGLIDEEIVENDRRFDHLVRIVLVDLQRFEQDPPFCREDAEEILDEPPSTRKSKFMD